MVSHSHRSINVLILIPRQSLFTRTDPLLRRVSTRLILALSRSLAVLSPLQETAGFASLTRPSPISRQCSPFRGQEGHTRRRRRTFRLRHLRTASTGNTTSIIHCVKLKCNSRRLPCGAHLSPLLPHKCQGWNCPHSLRRDPLTSRSSSRELHLLAIDDHIPEKICYPNNCDTTFTFGSPLHAFSQMCT